jgi:BirA family biotin operon repressor/biotin-[acetyl-CoA-carboxylase] ligase
MTGTKLDAVVVGIGVNVNIEVADFPEDLIPTVTSMQSATGERIDRLKLALSMRREILAASQILIEDGLDAILDELRAHDRSEGRAVLAARGEDEVEGIARGIDDRGHLRVELEDGSILAVQAGEVRFI